MVPAAALVEASEGSPDLQPMQPLGPTTTDARCWPMEPPPPAAPLAAPLLGYFLVWITVGTHLETSRGLGAATGVVKLPALVGAITADACRLLLEVLLLLLLLVELLLLVLPIDIELEELADPGPIVPGPVAVLLEAVDAATTLFEAGI